MVEELYRTLYEKGIFLKSSASYQDIEYDAPLGVFTTELRQKIKDCKSEMLEYLVEIEETAAILEYEQGNTTTLSRVLARKIVEHQWMCAREGDLKTRIRAHPFFQAVETACFSYLNCGLEIVRIVRVPNLRSR